MPSKQPASLDRIKVVKLNYADTQTSERKRYFALHNLKGALFYNLVHGVAVEFPARKYPGKTPALNFK
ncbi:hypothetical protein HO173_006975 [Letharia columbiana]|uniref:Uncharacterized protein n=1 Tax=Letharia columbiana TaxID=112416 RepID=A0A8H6FU71_9LECA|nr:uncharacterized protein HO173_006975 [Letharia columbiana]KAF6234755.1 hypothetical protein HO173_006975 [Letharia columbiana]